MSKEYVTLSREKLEELLKEAATDVYKMGLNDGINQAFEQMGEKISAMAVNFPNPVVRITLSELAYALLNSKNNNP